MGVRDRTTIGYEQRHNDKFSAGSEADLVKRVLDDLPKEPFYYSRMKEVNAESPQVLGDVPLPPVLTPQEFQGNAEKEDTLILDTREIEAFAGAHIKGSLNIALRSLFPI